MKKIKSSFVPQIFLKTFFGISNEIAYVNVNKNAV